MDQIRILVWCGKEDGSTDIGRPMTGIDLVVVRDQWIWAVKIDNLNGIARGRNRGVCSKPSIGSFWRHLGVCSICLKLLNALIRLVRSLSSGQAGDDVSGKVEGDVEGLRARSQRVEDDKEDLRDG